MSEDPAVGGQSPDEQPTALGSGTSPARPSLAEGFQQLAKALNEWGGSSGTFLKAHATVENAKRLAYTSALIGSIWGSIYYAIVVHFVPAIGLDALGPALVLIAASGLFFYLTFVLLLIGPGIAVNRIADASEIGEKAKNVFPSMIFLAGNVSALLIDAGILWRWPWWSYLAVLLISYLACLLVARWHNESTWNLVGLSLGPLIITLLGALYILLLVAYGVVPNGMSVSSIAALFGIVVGTTIAVAVANIAFSFAQRVGLRWLALAIACVIVIIVYSGVILRAPFRALRVGGFEAGVLLDKNGLNAPLIGACFPAPQEGDEVGLRRVYVVSDLGDDMVLSSWDPTKENANQSTASTTRSSPAPSPSVSPTPEVNCVVRIDKKHVLMLVLNPVPTPAAPTSATP